MIAAGFADHAEAIVAVMDIGEAREQVAGGLFGGIEIAGGANRWPRLFLFR